MFIFTDHLERESLGNFMRGKVAAIIVVSSLVVAIGIFATVYFTTYNNLVERESSTDAQWAQVEQELQRRYDLIPRVVNASQIYIKYEGSVLEEVTRLRSQWAAAVQTGDTDAINNATDKLESGISRLMVVVEDYPNLKASSIVQDLMIVLEGTENRISTERMRYNDAARDYNIAVKSFPGNLFAAGWGFDQKTYFQAKVGATEPPNVPM
jgi:LemA protein